MKALSAVWLTTLLTTVVATIAICAVARRWPGRQATIANLLLALVLAGASGAWIASTLQGQPFSAATSLPFALCDVATLFAAAALVTRNSWLVELTWFWGLAGTLQALLTPDLDVPFPRAEFFEYVLAHAGIVCAAFVLVVAERVRPRRLAAVRVFAVTLAYTGFVGVLDWATGGNYMYLRAKPSSWSLLSALGPWPWYIASGAGVAIALFALLDLPFAVQRAGERGESSRARGKEGERTRPPEGLVEGDVLRDRDSGVRPLADGGGRVRDHGRPDGELEPPLVGDGGQLHEAPALLTSKGGTAPSDDDARL